jgi:hypothetical protein
MLIEVASVTVSFGRRRKGDYFIGSTVIEQ